MPPVDMPDRTPIMSKVEPAGPGRHDGAGLLAFKRGLKAGSGCGQSAERARRAEGKNSAVAIVGREVRSATTPDALRGLFFHPSYAGSCGRRWPLPSGAGMIAPVPCQGNPSVRVSKWRNFCGCARRPPGAREAACTKEGRIYVTKAPTVEAKLGAKSGQHTAVTC